MAGHSKWANIKHRKAKADAKKGKAFSTISKEIITSVKLGGPDPKSNPRLRLVLQKAKQANVPNENVERNIKKGMSQDQADYEAIVYELYGFGGVGLIVEGMTDNRNRMASEMRIATNKRGGNIATPGAVTFNFDQRGVIEVPNDASIDESALFEEAIEAGALDFEKEEDSCMITTEPQDLMRVKETLEAKGYTIGQASLEQIPKNLIGCSLEDQEKNKLLIEWLEDIEDVDEVYHNMDL